MKNIIPKTYNEVIRKKRCYDLAKYYIISDEILVEIYNFLSSGDDCRMSATRNLIYFIEWLKSVNPDEFGFTLYFFAILN